MSTYSMLSDEEQGLKREPSAWHVESFKHHCGRGASMTEND